MHKYLRKASEVEVIYMDVGANVETLLKYTRGVSLHQKWDPYGPEGFTIEIDIPEQPPLILSPGNFLVRDEFGKLSVYTPQEFNQAFVAVSADA